MNSSRCTILSIFWGLLLGLSACSHCSSPKAVEKESSDLLNESDGLSAEAKEAAEGNPTTELDQQISDAVEPPMHLSLGYDSTCAWLSKGKVYCWGADNPEVAELSDIKDIVVSTKESCALKSDGSTRCWCRGEECEGGNALDKLQNILSLKHPRTRESICLLNNLGEIFCGVEKFKMNQQPTQAIEIVSTGNTWCAVSPLGEVECWGSDNAERGSGESFVPGSPTSPVGLPPVLSLKAGYSHYCALVEGGQVYCWGENQYGQMGVGHEKGITKVPTPVPELRNVVQLDANLYYNCARLDDGVVKCWGEVPQPYWDDPEVDERDDVQASSPWTLPKIEDATDMALGPWHMCVTLADERVYCWGWNGDGQLAVQSPSRFSKTPIEIDELNEVIQIGLGDHSACAMKADHSIWCWGDNGSDQLGVVTEWKEWGTPLQAPVPEGAERLIMRRDSACVLSKENAAACWGRDFDSPVRTGGRIEWYKPDPLYHEWIEPIDDIADISWETGVSCFISSEGLVGCCDSYASVCRRIESLKAPAKQVLLRYSTACALTEAGKVYCWPDNEYPRGQVPAERVPKLRNVEELMHGPNYSFCARKRDKSISCWEIDFDDSRERMPIIQTPTKLEGSDSMVSVVSDYGYSCALHDDGGVSCWGELCDGIASPEASRIEGIEGAIQVEVGKDFACVLLETGKVKCWGQGYSGQLGISSRYQPVELPWREALGVEE